MVASSWIGNAFPCYHQSSQLTQQRIGVVVGFQPEGGIVSPDVPRMVEVAVSPPPLTRAVANNRLNFSCVLIVFGLTSLMVEVVMLNMHFWELEVNLKLDMQAIYGVERLNLTGSRLDDMRLVRGKHYGGHDDHEDVGSTNYISIRHANTRQELEAAATWLKETRHEEHTPMLMVLVTWLAWLVVACLVTLIGRCCITQLCERRARKQTRDTRGEANTAWTRALRLSNFHMGCSAVLCVIGVVLGAEAHRKGLRKGIVTGRDEDKFSRETVEATRFFFLVQLVALAAAAVLRAESSPCCRRRCPTLQQRRSLVTVWMVLTAGVLVLSISFCLTQIIDMSRHHDIAPTDVFIDGYKYPDAGQNVTAAAVAAADNEYGLTYRLHKVYMLLNFAVQLLVLFRAYSIRRDLNRPRVPACASISV
eukprot:SAG22_NODE_79_length_21845_cov_17.798538_3_plen_420_part_00